MAFSFGGANKPSFGTTATTSAAPVFGFGTSTTGAAATTSTGFGFGTNTSTGTTSFGFGNPTTSTSTGFGGFGGFGSTAKTTASAFGFPTATTSTATTGFGGFGTGSTFGTGTAFGTGTTGSTFGGFGTGTTGTGFGTTTFGAAANAAQQQQAQQQSAANNLANMATAVSLPVIYGDERDALLAKWNQIQAAWGTGKGYYNKEGAVDFTADNPFCRFKAVGYSYKTQSKDSDGMVGILINKKTEEVKKVQQIIVDALHKILGSKQTLSVCVEDVKPLPDETTEFIIYLIERLPTGTTRRIPANELYNFMIKTPSVESELKKQLQVTNLMPKMEMSTEQLKNYLDNPPAGIDPILWQQAKLDNPDPANLIPVPMKGFKELHSRLKHQEYQTKLHQGRLDMISHDIAELQRNHGNMVARTEQYKRKHLELGHRVLQVMVRQEIYRKLGYGVQAEEEQFRVQLEALQAELNAPTQFKGRLNELMSQIRMQNQISGVRNDGNYQIDTALQDEIKQYILEAKLSFQHLKQQQAGLEQLIGVIKDDIEDLKLIEQGLQDPAQRR